MSNKQKQTYKHTRKCVLYLFVLYDIFISLFIIYYFLNRSWKIFVGFFCVFVPLENFSLIWRRHHCRWRAAKLDLCATLMAIEQWGFFNVPHLLWHGASVFNGYLRGPVTLIHVPNAERLAVELSLPVFTT